MTRTQTFNRRDSSVLGEFSTSILDGTLTNETKLHVYIISSSPPPSTIACRYCCYFCYVPNENKKIVCLAVHVCAFFSIVQVFGAEEIDNTILFYFFENCTNDHESERNDINNMRLSNGKMLCEQIREFTDDTKLYYILCLDMTDNSAQRALGTKKRIKEIHK